MIEQRVMHPFERSFDRGFDPYLAVPLLCDLRLRSRTPWWINGLAGHKKNIESPC